jgi:ABC-2 type transport system ATP-binding protein
MLALEFDHLTKRYGSRVVLNDLSLSVEAGQLYGFLGPNGAGKTTAIRLILGLAHAQGGSVRLFGEMVTPHSAGLRRVGLAAEGDSLYPFLSVRDNLRVLCDVRRVAYSRIEDVLRLVELQDRARDRYHTLSTGLRARLGIAAALLHRPDVLVLDEPTNGLDPQGMADLRRLLRELVNTQGVTVFLSSHLLNEVEHTCDRVAILHKGQLRREGRIQELVGTEQQLTLEVDDPVRARQVIGLPPGEGALHLAAIQREQIPGLIAQLVNAGINLYAVTPGASGSLERLFLELTTSTEEPVGNPKDSA